MKNLDKLYAVVNHGGLAVLVGPPGCGKTTLLNGVLSRHRDLSEHYFNSPRQASEVLSSPHAPTGRFVGIVEGLAWRGEILDLKALRSDGSALIYMSPGMDAAYLHDLKEEAEIAVIEFKN